MVEVVGIEVVDQVARRHVAHVQPEGPVLPQSLHRGRGELVGEVLADHPSVVADTVGVRSAA